MAVGSGVATGTGVFVGIMDSRASTCAVTVAGTSGVGGGVVGGGAVHAVRNEIHNRPTSTALKISAFFII